MHNRISGEHETSAMEDYREAQDLAGKSTVKYLNLQKSEYKLLIISMVQSVTVHLCFTFPLFSSQLQPNFFWSKALDFP